MILTDYKLKRVALTLGFAGPPTASSGFCDSQSRPGRYCQCAFLKNETPVFINRRQWVIGKYTNDQRNVLHYVYCELILKVIYLIPFFPPHFAGIMKIMWQP